MQVQQNTYGNLHPRTRAKFDNLSDDTRVYIARKGGRIVGTAHVVHDQITFGYGKEDRVLLFFSSAPTGVREELLTAAKQSTKHLKRRFSEL